MTDLPLSVIEAGRDAFFQAAPVENRFEAAYRAMQAADPDWVEMRAAAQAMVDIGWFVGAQVEAAERLEAALARTANETGSET